MVDALGWLNLFLIIIMSAIYPVKKLQVSMIKRKGKEQAKKYTTIYKKISTLHPILGIIIIVVGVVHGFLALGEFRLHTGSLIIVNLVLMAVTAIIGPKIKGLRKKWRNLHQGLALLLFVFIVIHLFWRSLL